VGLWQLNSKIVGSGYDKTFQFFNNGKFRLNYSSFDDNKRIVAVDGRYKISNGKLYMVIDYREEITGGRLAKGSPAFQREEFVLEGGQTVKIKQNDTTSVNEPFTIKKVKRDQTGEIISLTINFNQYYRLSDIPRVKE